MLRLLLLSLLALCLLQLSGASPRPAEAPSTGRAKISKRQTSRTAILERRARPQRRDQPSALPKLCGAFAPGKDFQITVSASPVTRFQYQYLLRFSANAANQQDALRATGTQTTGTTVRLNNDCQLVLADGRIGSVDGGPNDLSFVNFVGSASSLASSLRPLTCDINALSMLTCSDAQDGRLLRLRVNPTYPDDGTLVYSFGTDTDKITDGTLTVVFST